MEEKKGRKLLNYFKTCLWQMGYISFKQIEKNYCYGFLLIFERKTYLSYCERMTLHFMFKFRYQFFFCVDINGVAMSVNIGNIWFENISFHSYSREKNHHPKMLQVIIENFLQIFLELGVKRHSEHLLDVIVLKTKV